MGTLGGLIQEHMPPNLGISIILYGKIVLILEAFDLHGTFQEPINHANS
jgi:hypothetical protein